MQPFWQTETSFLLIKFRKMNQRNKRPPDDTISSGASNWTKYFPGSAQTELNRHFTNRLIKKSIIRIMMTLKHFFHAVLNNIYCTFTKNEGDVVACIVVSYTFKIVIECENQKKYNLSILFFIQELVNYLNKLQPEDKSLVVEL